MSNRRNSTRFPYRRRRGRTALQLRRRWGVLRCAPPLPGWRNGRRGRLKIGSPRGGRGSSPLLGTGVLRRRPQVIASVLASGQAVPLSLIPREGGEGCPRSCRAARAELAHDPGAPVGSELGLNVG